MAVSLKGMRSELEEALDSIERTLSTSWAVYTKFDPQHNRRVITEIVPWGQRYWGQSGPWGQRYLDTKPIKIVDAIDEMDAYKKFMEKFK
jgi:hypothetical protein